jgi:acetolactate synthase-1/2/3 large subunit
MKISDAVIMKLSALGVNQAFCVTGGAAMHLNDSAGQFSNLNITYMHHEQACAMAAEGYARIKLKPALMITTAGPGAINTLNGVFGAFTDSIPMIVLAGQPRKNTQKSFYHLDNLRQLGDQEAPMLDMVCEITKAQFEVTQIQSADEILLNVEEIYRQSNSGRPGPVWLEIPVDIQGETRDFDLSIIKRALPAIELSPKSSHKKEFEILLKKIYGSMRPVMLIGTGVKIAGATDEAIRFAEKFEIPIITTWCHDIIQTDHRLFMGRSGTIGTRPGNIILQNSDLLIVVGSRLNIRQIGYNYERFAPNAYKVQVDVDESELEKPFPDINLKFNLDAREFFTRVIELVDTQKNYNNAEKWLQWCRLVNQNFSIKESDYPQRDSVINPYHLIPKFFQLAPPKTIFACGNATACIVPFQTAIIKKGTILFSNGGSASMGYDLPSAIGASIADPKNLVICFAGDGSIMMNIQELQTLATLELNIIIVILDNGGYLSIKQTQKNFFNRQHGSDKNSGLSFPDFEKITTAFGIPTLILDDKEWARQIDEAIKMGGPRALICTLDPLQEFEPRLKSRVVDGQILTPELDDMYPHLDSSVLASLREVIND